MAGSDKCYVHNDPAAWRAAASRGGRQKPGPAPEEWCASDSPRDRARWLSEQLARVFEDVRNGEIEPGRAHACAAVANALRGSLGVEAELGEIREEIDRLAALVGERDAC